MVHECQKHNNKEGAGLGVNEHQKKRIDEYQLQRFLAKCYSRLSNV